MINHSHDTSDMPAVPSDLNQQQIHAFLCEFIYDKYQDLPIKIVTAYFYDFSIQNPDRSLFPSIDIGKLAWDALQMYTRIFIAKIKVFEAGKVLAQKRFETISFLNKDRKKKHRKIRSDELMMTNRTQLVREYLDYMKPYWNALIGHLPKADGSVVSDIESLLEEWVQEINKFKNRPHVGRPAQTTNRPAQSGQRQGI